MLDQILRFLNQTRIVVDGEEKRVKKLEEMQKRADTYREEGYEDLANKLDAKVDKGIERGMKILTKLSEMLENIQM